MTKSHHTAKIESLRAQLDGCARAAKNLRVENSLLVRIAEAAKAFVRSGDIAIEGEQGRRLHSELWDLLDSWKTPQHSTTTEPEGGA